MALTEEQKAEKEAEKARKQAEKEAETAIALKEQKEAQELQAKHDAEAEALRLKTEAERKAREELEASPSKQAYKELIETYRKQNPVKYELKKEEFARKLASL